MSTRELVDETRSDYSCFNVVHLATARAAELAAFEAEVNVTTAHAITCLQRLPVRLRRRAASHRVNRLPRRLHRHFQQPLNNNKGQLVAAQPKRAKLKSRRYRRRHLRLLAMATRIAATSSSYSELSSNRKTLWLPTHLWHAKRYHMINIWGWRLPQAPNDKIFKACQDAALK
ncbi:ribonuclease P/MRP protein subunit POP1 [Opisthorchis viverrini]|uniref:Ribonuclease P/MRP protein subunit POP1 n=1 Tax=Opisthorchis viverrini TaxID=6198 RepID=A0A1S8X7F9_OPIVI|nr:ribonuclease P/MRP protein subunit POP1 [Opisthorchis viverrini]